MCRFPVSTHRRRLDVNKLLKRRRAFNGLQQRIFVFLAVLS